MLAAQSSAAAKMARLPSTTPRSLQANVSGLKSETRPVRPTTTPITRRGVSDSRSRRAAAGVTQSGVV